MANSLNTQLNEPSNQIHSSPQSQLIKKSYSKTLETSVINNNLNNVATTIRLNAIHIVIFQINS